MADDQAISSRDGRATAESSSEVTDPERWEAVASDIERQQVTTACQRLEQDSSLSDAQRATVERLAATIVEQLTPAAGRVLTERK
ncbi:hypothetical protein [Natronosalvus vescus]|uniref:hypothetical protein n=1 Tax=Natronosalvus vescus TaxID=2953881 RepID=UPI00209004BB|nr:hypothetical protein [Natronosalvus vescus]